MGVPRYADTDFPKAEVEINTLYHTVPVSYEVLVRDGYGSFVSYPSGLRPLALRATIGCASVMLKLRLALLSACTIVPLS